MVTDQEFLQKEWPQHCGDILIIKDLQTEKIKDKRYFNCEFKNHPYQLKCQKHHVLRGVVNNPQIEIDEFINVLWPQYCGDTLKILRKTEEREIRSNGELGNILFECEFQKYPYKIKALKNHIINGYIINPRIEVEEFINKLWPQPYGEILKVIRKTEEREIYSNGYKGDILYECEFQKYPCKIKETKDDIKKGNCINPNFPWKTKDLLEKYIKENFKEKPTLQEILDSFEISTSVIISAINKFGLRNLVQYYSSHEENSLRNYIQEITGSLYQNYNDINYEIDIFLGNIGIEYNGSYWHQEGIFKEIGYHEKKFKYFLSKGILIFQIWDYFWFKDRAHKVIRQEAKDYINNLIKIFTTKYLPLSK